MGKKRAQSWSVDLMVAVSLFLMMILSFFFITSAPEESVQEDLTFESESIPESLIASRGENIRPTVFVIDNKVDTVQLNRILGMNYDEIKRELGIKNDFCIHFEDEEGNIINVNEDKMLTRYSIGSSRFNISLVNSTGQIEAIIRCGT